MARFEVAVMPMEGRAAW